MFVELSGVLNVNEGMANEGLKESCGGV